MKDAYKIYDEYNPERKGKVLVVFDDMTVDKVCNKKLHQIVTELFITGTK